MFLDSTRENMRLWNTWQQALPELNLTLISSYMPFWLVIIVPKQINSTTFPKDLVVIATSRVFPAFKLTIRQHTGIPSFLGVYFWTNLLTYNIYRAYILYTYICYLLVDSNLRPRPTADVFQLLSVPSGFPGPSFFYIEILGNSELYYNQNLLEH
jgi:hypothetical protein